MRFVMKLLEQRILQDLLRSAVNESGNPVIEAGGDGIQLDHVFFHGALLHKKSTSFYAEPFSQVTDRLYYIIYGIPVGRSGRWLDKGSAVPYNPILR